MPTDPWFWLVVFGGACVHWMLPRGWRAAFLTVISVGFLFTKAPESCAALAAWTVAFYFLAPRTIGSSSKAGSLISVMVLGSLGYLAYFKYIPPLIHTLWPDATGMSLVLPMGISYYTFKLIHYAVEVRRENITDRSFWTFCAYIYLFPIFTAGPIQRFDRFVEDREETFSREALTDGLTRIAHGLIKKFVFAKMIVFDWMMQGQGADFFFADFGRQHSDDALRLIGCSFLFAYLDFAAYSDIAIGSSRLFGLKIQENFDWPLLAPDIGSLWKRWHMTLAGWCQAYVYLPMIGLTRNPYLGVLFTFLVMGLWHAGSLNFICWGLYHALGVTVALVFARQSRKRRWKVPRTGVLGLWRNALTLVFFAGSFVFSLTNGRGIKAAAMLGLRVFGVELE